MRVQFCCSQSVGVSSEEEDAPGVHAGTSWLRDRPAEGSIFALADTRCYLALFLNRKIDTAEQYMHYGD